MLNLTFSTHTTIDSKAKIHGISAGAVYSPVAGNSNQVAGHYMDPATGKQKAFVATRKPKKLSGTEAAISFLWSHHCTLTAAEKRSLQSLGVKFNPSLFESLLQRLFVICCNSF